MFLLVDTRDPRAVEQEVQAIYAAMFPSAEPLFIPMIFGWALDCFTGHYEDYQAIDARYHDFEHTLQGTLCLARLLHGYHEAGAEPALTEGMFQLSILAILLHDTGYLKKRDDVEGTGAKYTLTHVSRSAEFAFHLLSKKGYRAADIATVQHMIRCTGVNVDLTSIPFQNDLEMLAGFSLGTADLLGQMAALDYVDRLPILYLEFAESARYNGGKMTTAGNFASSRDLIEKTPLFWEKYVHPKLERDFRGVFRYLERPVNSGQNVYIDRISANIQRLKESIRMRANSNQAVCVN
jgi:hypothetical protein